MSLLAGARIGPYEIVAPIGAGGMGEVYRARDARLDRDVAIKILPAAFAADAERLARFEREAKTLAALNHPNIAAIYGIEIAPRVSPAGASALVMELVEGEDLAQRLARGPIVVDEALKIARHIAAALDAAHERGIIHRDLKPANVKLRSDGTVKLLDFGLAKALDASAGSDPDGMNSPTITSPATQVGMILGTAAYMAPEQARGKPVDKRADIWAFGCVLYEMLTARRAFAGSDVSETLASVLARDVDWSVLPAGTPAPVVALLRACLQKEKRERLRDLGDAWLPFAVASGGAAAQTPARARWVPWTVAAAALVITSALGITLMPSDPAVPFHLSITLPDGYRVTAPPVISADGRRVVFSAGDGRGQPKIYLRDLDTFDTRELAGTDGADRPFLSPDGRWIGYFANGQLHTMDLEGGAPTRLAAAPSNGGGTWADDGTIVFVPTWNGGLYKIASRGGEPELLIKPDPAKKEYAYTSPHFLPGGRELLFATWGAAFNIERLSLPGLERAVAAPGLWGAPAYAGTGHVLVPNKVGDLLAVPFPPRADATPVAVLSNVHWRGGAGDGTMKFAVSRNGTLVYAPSDNRQRRLALVDEQGQAVTIPGDLAPFDGVSVAPEGRRAAATVDGVVVLVDLARGTRTPVYPGRSGAQTAPTWSADGSRLLFAANGEGNWEIYETVPGRTEPLAVVLQRPFDQFPISLAPDGTLMFLDIAPGMGGNLWMRAPDGTVSSWLATGADEAEGVFSPDGSLVAYMSDVSGRQEVYVQPRDRGVPAVRVSATGGAEPQWSPDGDRLYFRQRNLMFAAGVRRRPSLTVAEPRLLFDGGWQLEHEKLWSVMPDGKRFLMVRFEPAAIPTRLDVIVNWFDELRKRAPVK